MLSTASASWLLHGRPEPERPLRKLRAGPLVVGLDGVDVRYARVGRVEVVRRITVAVRNGNWLTVPGIVQSLDVVERADAFEVEFDVLHEHQELRFAWHGSICGSARGTLRYAVDGHALSGFEYCRIGICVLHPPRQIAGRPFRMATAEGSVRTGTMPLDVGPMGRSGSTSVPLFEPFSSLAVVLAEGGETSFEFTGELFEIEDQRNWADGSFKTYCPPIGRQPYSAAVGERFFQEVELDARSVLARAPAAHLADEEVVRLELGDADGSTLPPIGLCLSGHGDPLGAHEAALLRRLAPGHLRVDVAAEAADPKLVLARARATAATLDCPIELAVRAREDDTAGLRRLASALAGLDLVRILVFDEEGGSESTPATLATRMREIVATAAPGVLVGGGSDRTFCELNRTRPDVEALEVVCFPTNATFHEHDRHSLVETLEAQGEAVRSARAFAGGRPVVAGPVALTARRPPYGTRFAGQARALPPEVDARQLSLFAAGWTLGSVKYAAEAGAAALTLFETTGWRGVVEREAGSPLPEEFPSAPGMAFPLYFVLLALADLRGAPLIGCSSSEPLVAIGLAARLEDEVRLLVANLTPECRRVAVGGIPPGAEVDACEWLAARDLPEALLRPEWHAPRPSPIERRDGVVLELSSFALAVVRVMDVASTMC